MLGRSVVMRADNDYECWFVQEGFAGGTGPNSKQVHLSIWRYASPKADDVMKTRASIANDHTAQFAVKDVAGIGDAALWSWTPGWGKFDAFRGGTIRAEVIISGLPENTALEYAKKLAARPLGTAGGSRYAYEGASAADVAQASAAATVPQSPAAYRDTWKGQTKVVRGTVSRLEMESTGSSRFLTVYFKESPGGAFVVCSPRPEAFTENVGDLNRMIGKTVEVTGLVGPGSVCAGKGGEIGVMNSSSYRIEGLQAASTAVAAGSLPFGNPKGPRLGLDICNAGKAAFDAVVAKPGRTTVFHIPPALCAHAYEDTKGPASVGFAFTDSRGQWVSARRVDALAASTEIWGRGSGENLSVRRGNANVVVPAQMLFHPPQAVCHTDIDSTPSAVSQLPLSATPADLRAARAEDMARPNTTTTVCENKEYDLNVVAYPDTREVTFYKKCFACPPATSPAEQAQSRADWRHTTATMSKISPMAGGIMKGITDRAQDSALQDSLEGPPDYQLMSWDELKRIPARPPGGGRPSQMPQYFAMRGTVSRVEMRPAPSGINRTGTWVNVYFRESAEQATGAFGTSYGAFNVCTWGTEIFEEMFGPDFRTRMIGQVLEVEGEYGQGCMGWKGSISIAMSRQVRKIASK
jgi:hypothetical protein